MSVSQWRQWAIGFERLVGFAGGQQQLSVFLLFAVAVVVVVRFGFPDILVKV